MSLKSETKDTPPQTAVLFYFFLFFRSLLLAKDVFPKTKIERQTVEDEQINLYLTLNS